LGREHHDAAEPTNGGKGAAAAHWVKRKYRQRQETPEHVRRLIDRQRQHLGAALADLNTNWCKTGHWIWWALPTSTLGRGEPPPATYVTAETGMQLARFAPPEWRQTLESIAWLLARKPLGQVLPAIDHPRVQEFVLLWEAVTVDYWLRDTLRTLRHALPPPFGGNGGFDDGESAGDDQGSSGPGGASRSWRRQWRWRNRKNEPRA